MKASKVVSEDGRFDFVIKAVYQKTLSKVLFMVNDGFVSVKMKATYTFGVKTIDNNFIVKDREVKYFPLNTPVDDINLFGKLLSKGRKEVDYVLTIVEYIYS